MRKSEANYLQNHPGLQRWTVSLRDEQTGSTCDFEIMSVRQRCVTFSDGCCQQTACLAIISFPLSIIINTTHPRSIFRLAARKCWFCSSMQKSTWLYRRRLAWICKVYLKVLSLRGFCRVPVANRDATQGLFQPHKTSSTKSVLTSITESWLFEHFRLSGGSSSSISPIKPLVLSAFSRSGLLYLRRSGLCHLI